MSVTSVFVDASVPMSILDHHSRRGTKQSRVIGALYGIVCNDTVEIRQTLPILHDEDPVRESVTVGTQLWESMARNARKVHLAPLVGWYASDTCPTDAIIDQLFAARIGSSNVSLRFILDASLKHGSLRMRVLSATEVTLMDKNMRIYSPVNFYVSPCNAAQSGILDGLLAMVSSNRIAAQRSSTLNLTSSPIDTIEGNSGESKLSLHQPPQIIPTTLHRLRDELDMLLGYIDRISNSTNHAHSVLNSEQLFEMQQALRKVPKLPIDIASKLRDNAVQDGSTMQYLARIIHVQTSLIDRLLALVHGG